MAPAQLWGIGLATTTLIGFGLAIWQTLRAEQLNRRQRDLDWPRFRSAASDLARRVDRSGFMPDLILALSERGAMVAYLVARELRRQVPIVTLTVLFGDDGRIGLPGYTASLGTHATILVPDGIGQLNDRRVLLVDDWIMSGDGMARIRDLLLAEGFAANRLRTATVIATKLAVANRKGPDFLAREVEGIDFYFPWGRAE